MQELEYRSIINKLRHSDDKVTKYGIPALMASQFHVIGRVDDCCKWQRENLAVHKLHFQNAAKAGLAWSKKFTEERQAPWQFLFGLYGHSILCPSQCWSVH